MRDFFSILFFFSFTNSVIGQTKPLQNKSIDSVIVKYLQREVPHPYDDYGGTTTIGFDIVKISKDDSVVKIQSLFHLDSTFEFVPSRSFSGRLNNKLKTLLPDSYSVIIPIHFYFGNQQVFTKTIQKKLDRQLRIYKRRKYYISEHPVICYMPEPRRRSGCPH
jgi:hypothetical protein